jgi:hypothetical protein
MGRGFAAIGAGLVALVACTKSPSAVTGELRLRVESNLLVPLDWSVLSVDVTFQGSTRSALYPLSPGTEGSVVLPVTLPLVVSDDAGSVVTVRVKALQDGEVLVAQQRKTRIPVGRTGYVAMALSASCEEVECGDEETCVFGTCTAQWLDPSALPEQPTDLTAPRPEDGGREDAPARDGEPRAPALVPVPQGGIPDAAKAPCATQADGDLCAAFQTGCGELLAMSACGFDRFVFCGPCSGEAKEAVGFSPGAVVMGSTLIVNETPPHAVNVGAFALDRSEVTVASYDACVVRGECTPAGTGPNCNAGKGGRENHPINCVSWAQASAYCRVRGQRLPTEEEWECAARGGAGGTRTYPWGEDIPTDERACSSVGAFKRQSSCAVGSVSPAGDSAQGLRDMAGNVWEWTSSGWSEDYGVYRGSVQRTVRGGGWYLASQFDLRGSARMGVGPETQEGYLGFRCAK